ncbi:MAG: tetratricopeptide repeat protein [Bdellovibrionota bacterium]
MFFKRALLVLALFLASCTSYQAADYNQAQEAVEKKHYLIAVNFLDHAIKRAPQTNLGIKAAREAARISLYETKDYKKAIEYYRHLVLYSKEPSERIQAQKDVATIYFDHLQSYQEAIIEFSKLLQMPHMDFDLAKYKLSIARAHYYLNNFFQAESEINEILRLKIDDQMRFNTLLLQGNILVAQKNYLRAAEIFRNVIQAYPETAKKENVALTLAVCYEESQDYPSAIKMLEQLRGQYTPVEYIDLRIKRLKERQKNQPGAKRIHK